jgi:hypothetical protein
VVALAAAHPGAQNEQQRPDAFAAGKQDMAPHLGDQRHVGLEIGLQRAIDGGHVRRQVLQNAFIRGNHCE